MVKCRCGSNFVAKTKTIKKASVFGCQNENESWPSSRDGFRKMERARGKTLLMLMSGHWINNTTMHFIICVRVAMLTLRSTTHIVLMMPPFFPLHFLVLLLTWCSVSIIRNAQYEFMKFIRCLDWMRLPSFIPSPFHTCSNILQFGATSNLFCSALHQNCSIRL